MGASGWIGGIQQVVGHNTINGAEEDLFVPPAAGPRQYGEVGGDPCPSPLGNAYGYAEPNGSRTIARFHGR